MLVVKTKKKVAKKVAKKIVVVDKLSKIVDTEIIVILDRSGSMQLVKSDMEGGFDNWIRLQRELDIPGKCLVSLAEFNTGGVRYVYESLPLNDVPYLMLEPMGGTPLLDAVGEVVTRAVSRLTNSKSRVLCVILTDGQENSSITWKKDQVKKLITDQQSKGWEFVFLGVGIDAFAEANVMGIAMGQTLSTAAGPAGVQTAFAALNTSSKSYRSGGSSSPINP